MKSLFFVAVVFLLLMSACDISKPKMPSWDVELNVPLTSQKLYVSDLADGENITIGEDELLTLTGEGDAQTNPFGEVNYTPNVAVSNIPLTANLSNHSVPLSIVDPLGKVFLSYGQFETGSITISFTPLVSGISVMLDFPQVKNANGTIYSIVHDGSPVVQNFPLYGCTIGTEDSGLILSTLDIRVTVQGTGSGTVGFLGVELNNPLGFDYFQGRLIDYRRNFLGEIAPIDIDYPWGLEDAVRVEGARLLVNLTNQMGFEAEFHGEIFAKNNRTLQTRSIPITDTTATGEPTPYLADEASESGPGLNNYVFSKNFSQLLEIMPDYVELRNAYLLINSHEDEIGYVNEDNRMFVHYVVEAPLRLTVYDSIIRMQDPVKVEISEDNRDMIRDNVLSADLAVQLMNKVPLGGEATLYVGTSENIDPAIPGSYSFTKSFTLLSSLVPGGDAWQPNAYNPNLQITLSDEELDVFTNPEVYLLFTFHFAPSDGVVEISAGPESYVEVRAMLNGMVRIEEDM